MKTIFVLLALFTSPAAFAKVSCNINTGSDSVYGTILKTVDVSDPSVKPEAIFIDKTGTPKVVPDFAPDAKKRQLFVLFNRANNDEYSISVGDIYPALVVRLHVHGQVIVDRPLMLTLPTDNLSIICFSQP